MSDGIHFFFYSCGHSFRCCGSGPDIRLDKKCSDCERLDRYPFWNDTQLDRIERKIDELRK